jgi:DNA replication protein DnaC
MGILRRELLRKFGVGEDRIDQIEFNSLSEDEKARELEARATINAYFERISTPIIDNRGDVYNEWVNTTDAIGFIGIKPPFFKKENTNKIANFNEVKALYAKCLQVCSNRKFVENGNNKAIIVEVLKYVTGFECKLNPKKGFIISSKQVGTGKTTIFNALALLGSHIHLDNPIGRIMNTSDLQRDYQQYGYKALNEYFEKTICFDDIGTETPTSHFGDKKYLFGEIIEKRYITNAKTFGTTNLTSSELLEIYGARAYSRLKDMVTIIELTNGKDLRG